MILNCSHLSKAFGTNEILKDISFHVEEREKTAVIGINGAGKSTLLKLIMNELTPDEGTVTLTRGASVGYLAQHEAVSGKNTIYRELLSVKQDILDMEARLRSLESEMKHQEGERLSHTLEQYNRLSTEFERQNGYACQSEVVGVMKGLGFGEEDFEQSIATLSGGQKTRVALGKLLLSRPDLILLDEPTNHLDMNSIAWLETYLVNYPGAVIIVAHDRYFLNKVVTKIVELDNGHGMVFLGNYSAYAEKKAMLRSAQIKAWLNQQQEIRHQEQVITKLKSFNREKSIKRAESREKQLDKMERLEKPVELNTEMHLQLRPRFESGEDVLSVEHLAKSFGNNHLFSDLNFSIRRGEKVAIIGNNGTGKTTLLKILNSVETADAGSFALGSRVKIGYYDQEHHILHPEKNLFEEISDDYPTLTNTEIRSTLAAFLFTADDVFKKISDLSGGERGRVSLAKLMLSEANFLILDEPTNHLDITSREILEEALNQYTGTVLYVSHDRYFINSTASRILDLTGNTLVNYIGNYDYYLEKREELTRIYAPDSMPSGNGIFGQCPAPSTSHDDTDAKRDWKQKKEEQARLRKRQNDLKKTEDAIQQLEARDAELNEELTREAVYSDPAACMRLNQEKTGIAQKLEELYALWEELM